MEDQKIEFLPFHALNEFMRPDFRLIVLRAAFSALPTLPPQVREPVDHLVKKLVKVPGFRHSEKAPPAIKLLPSVPIFEKNSEFVAAILAAWTEANASLRDEVYAVLKARGWYFFPTEFKSLAEFPLPKTESEWGILPPEADRKRLPGFVIYWPKAENFEVIYQSYTEMYPEGNASIDQVSLMAVWLSMRLPYHHTHESEKEETTHDQEHEHDR